MVLLSSSASKQTHTHIGVHRRSLTRTDGVNGDEDRGVKQRSEIWRQQETESQNKRRGSRGMEHRIKMTYIKAARRCGENFPLPEHNYTEISEGWEKDVDQSDS